MDEELRERLETVERALTDGETDLSGLAGEAATADRVAELEAAVADLEDRIAEQEAAIQAVRGYVGNVRSVNEDVARRADAALAAVESTDRDAGDDSAAKPRGETANEITLGNRDGRGNPGRSVDDPSARDRDHRHAADRDTPTGGRGPDETAGSDTCSVCGRSDADPAGLGDDVGHGSGKPSSGWAAGSRGGGGGEEKIDRLATGGGLAPTDDDRSPTGPSTDGWPRDGRDDAPMHVGEGGPDRATDGGADLDGSLLARVRNLL